MYFTFSPGAGGVHEYYYGAGGGGVLIDGIGPSGDEGHGEGYGAGGSNYERDGYAGVILLELKRHCPKMRTGYFRSWGCR